MPKLLSDTIGKHFLKALGLDGRGVRELTIRMRVHEPVSIIVEMEGLEVPNGAEGMAAAATLLKGYHLVPISADDGVDANAR